MTVEVSIYSHDFDLSPQLEDMISKKVGRLDRYLPAMTEARVDLTIERNARSAEDRKVAQLTIRSRGSILRAEERTADMRTSVEAVVEKIQRQIERYKAKHYRGRGNGAGTDEMIEELPAELEEEPGELPAIARRKRHQLTPMNEAEAMEQMALLGHDSFFVFFNAESNAVNVLYRRQNGTLGLIETEIG
jgi:putative sigma-54 modulation protein